MHFRAHQGFQLKGKRLGESHAAERRLRKEQQRDQVEKRQLGDVRQATREGARSLERKKLAAKQSQQQSRRGKNKAAPRARPT